MTGRSVRARIKRAIPAIVRRDEKIAALQKRNRRLESQARTTQRAQREVTQLRESLKRPSLQRSLDDLRRSVVSLRSVDTTKSHPLRQLPFKLRNYRLAASHGVPVPEVYATWPSVADIDLSQLPDSFVLKSDGGAGGHGVIPLTRVAEDAFTVVSTDKTLTTEDLKERLRSVKSLSGPFFAEELLQGAGSDRIPEDVKIFVFYGSVGQILLRRADEHGNLLKTFYKFVDEHGNDLGEAVADHRLDPTIAAPRQLSTMVEMAKHLSRAVGVPFVRVDLYETDRGVVLGELTRVPGGHPAYSSDHDAFMGKLYEDGRWRLETDLAAGRPAGVLHGSHDAPDLYPPGHVSQSEDPGTWAIRQAPCETWCTE